MLYYKNLEEVIFKRHNDLDSPDELIIISGYLGPSPIRKLIDLPFQCKVIGGMYPQGLNIKLFESLEENCKTNKKLQLFFSTIEVHSKIYIWKKDGEIIHALIGSANFSNNGLYNDFRESLAVTPKSAFSELAKYISFIEHQMTAKPILNTQPRSIAKNQDFKKNFPYSIQYKYDFPLFYINKQKEKDVYGKSGLNWGFSKGNVSLGDAYIPIPTNLLDQNQVLIPPIPMVPIIPGRKKKNFDPIEIIWDDGTIMEGSLEGSRSINSVLYPKQISSYSSEVPFAENGDTISVKSILGRYLRKRLKVELAHKIKYKDLKEYGRDTVTLSLIQPGVYYADFSVK